MELNKLVGFLEFGIKIDKTQSTGQVNLAGYNEDIFGLSLYFFMVELILKQFSKLALVSVDKLSILVQQNSIILGQVKVLLAGVKVVRVHMLQMRVDREVKFYDRSLFTDFFEVVGIRSVLGNRIDGLAQKYLGFFLIIFGCFICIGVLQIRV